MPKMKRTLGPLLMEILEDVPSGVNEASRHIACVLRREGHHAIGLCPASDEVAVLPAAVHIGVALAEQSGAPAALMEANARWSALPAADPVSRPGLRGEERLLTRWVAGDRLAVVSLAENAGIGAGLLELGRVLRSGRSMFEKVLVDMTGLDRLGEHLSAAAMCDALLFVARAGVTTEGDLERLRDAFRAQRTLGVILTGTSP